MNSPFPLRRRFLFSVALLLALAGWKVILANLAPGPRSSPAAVTVASLPSDATFPRATADAQVKHQNVTLQALPQAEQESLWAALSAARRKVQTLTVDEAAMEQNLGVRCFATNPGQQISARFLDGAVRIESGRGGAWAGTLSLAQSGEKSQPAPSGTCVDYRRADGVTEWFENKPEGIEHGFSLAQRPPSASPDEVRVVLTLHGLTARDDGYGGEALEFVDPATGTAVLRYSALKAWDATGRVVPARMEGAGNRVRLLLADAGAIYPVTIDPLITSQEAKLGPEFTGDGAGGDNFGKSVALAGDTALVGAYGDYTAAGGHAGSAYVFVRSGELWTLQAKLTAGDAATGDYFGKSVALSGDTALVGAVFDGTAGGPIAGSTYVFVRSGTAWSQQAKLTAGNSLIDARFGSAVALEGDTALVGANGDDPTAGYYVGSAYVFVRTGTAWNQQAKLTAGDAATYDGFGSSVALAGDTVLVGSPRARSVAAGQAGSAYVFVRSGTGWSQQAKLMADDAAPNDGFGNSVALSGDTALAGSSADDTAAGNDAGSAYVFVRSGSVWSQQAKLTSSDAASGDSFGISVVLSGETALAGAYSDDTADAVDAGSAYVFVRTGTAWSQQSKLTAGDATSGDSFGNAIALSSDTVLIGAIVADTTAGTDAGSAYVFRRSGSVWSQQAKLTAGDAASGDRFGAAVALSGETALVGAFLDYTAAGKEAGNAYVFVRSGTAWSQQAKLTAGDPSARDRFGNSVALAGDTALIGSVYDESSGVYSAGSVYVFVRSGPAWSQQAKLTAADAAQFDYFGSSVALSSDTALVGATGTDTATLSSAGSAYVFVRSGTAWSQQAKLTANAAASVNFFGNSVALSGNTALVGAYAQSPNRDSPGSAYVFIRSGPGWSQQAKLTAADAAPDDWFGNSVALSGNTALVGSPASDRAGVGSNTGSAYVFVRNGSVWSQQTKLTAGDAAGFDYFGNSVALSGNTALIGAPRDSTEAGNWAGSAYVFERSGTAWSQQAKVTAGDAAADDLFGSSVALSGDTLLVGAVDDDTAHPVTGDPRFGHGSVYVFRLLPPAAPLPVLHEATGLTATGATLNGTVNPNGVVTTARFEYGLSASYGSTASVALSPAGGAASQSVSAVLSGLAPRTIYHYRLSATNSLGAAATADSIFTTLSPLEAWRQQHFGTTADAGPAASTADPDGDGLVNLLEYATLLNPAAPAPLGSTLALNGGMLAFTFPRNKAATDASISVKWTDDLTAGSWSSAGVTETLLSDDGTLQIVRATLPRGAARRFVLLEVSMP